MAIAIFGYHYGMGRKFEYDKSISAIGILGYLSTTVFQQMFFGMTMFSNFLSILKRVGEVLDMEEFDSSEKEDNAMDLPKNTRIKIDDASFTWGFSVKKDKDSKNTIEDKADDINLENINFTAKDGDLIAIVGAVGAGKSTFLSAIMKELVLLKGEVSILEFY